MSLKSFESHLRDPAPGFRCYASGDRSENMNFVARVTNHIGRAASPRSVVALGKLCGTASPALIRFVKDHDGVLLYKDDNSDAAGIALFKVQEWPSRTEEMRESMMAMSFEEEDMPEWFHGGVVFGEIPHSSNYLVIQLNGSQAGRVVYCDHDDFKVEAFAASFDVLLSMIVDDPPGFLYKCGCFTRYSDGKTKIQWIPKEYIADCRSGERTVIP
jgi:hypothetical protein